MRIIEFLIVLVLVAVLMGMVIAACSDIVATIDAIKLYKIY
jgi:hypothetical protein